MIPIIARGKKALRSITLNWSSDESAVKGRYKIPEKGDKKMARKVMKKAIAAIVLVVSGGAVLFLGSMLVFGMGAALGW